MDSIKLLNKTQVPTPYKTNSFYYFRLKISSKNNAPIANSVVSIDFNLIHFPSYLINDYLYPKTKIAFKRTLLDFTQMSKRTDNNGEVLIRLKIKKPKVFSIFCNNRILIKPNYIGYYAITFKCQGVLTEPLEMVTEFLPYTIYTAEQPSFDYNHVNRSNFTKVKQYFQRSGDFLPKVLIN